MNFIKGNEVSKDEVAFRRRREGGGGGFSRLEELEILEAKESEMIDIESNLKNFVREDIKENRFI